MNNFEEISKLGYKHYLSYTVEELNQLDINSKDFLLEVFLIFDWVFEKHDIYADIFPTIVSASSSSGIRWNYNIYISEKEVLDNFKESPIGYLTKGEAYQKCFEKLIKKLKKHKK
jgi:hypothetical protein